jgi:hypothetical protein
LHNQKDEVVNELVVEEELVVCFDDARSLIATATNTPPAKIKAMTISAFAFVIDEVCRSLLGKTVSSEDIEQALFLDCEMGDLFSYPLV